MIAIVCISHLLTATKQASQFFQKSQLDLKSARQELANILKTLEGFRQRIVPGFANLFEEVLGIAREIDVEIRMPRVTGRQNHRENYQTNNIIDYYRQSIYAPALDNIIEDIKSRFSEETLNLFNLSIVFPDFKDVIDMNEAIPHLAKKYSSFLNETNKTFSALLRSELVSWNLKWENMANVGPRSALDLLDNCDKEVFTIIHFLLRILVTLPISNAQAERMFSCLRRLKTWLRSTMGQDRLTGLALLMIHYDFPPDPERVLDRYDAKGPHRCDYT